MAHALPTSPGRRRRIRLIAAAAVAAVVIALAVGGLIIRNHRDHSRATAPGRTTASRTSATAPTTPPTTTTPITTTPLTATLPNPATTSASTPTTSSSPTTAPVIKVGLVVDNNTDLPDLASKARSRFEAGGWTVTKVGKISDSILSTCAFYDPSNPKNRAAAEALRAQFPAIKRVKPRFPRLPRAPIVVVLTRDYS